MPVAHAANWDALTAKKTHTEDGSVGDDIDACRLQLLDSGCRQQLVLEREVGVRHDGVKRLASLGQNSVRKRAEDWEWVAGDSDVLDCAFFVSYPPQLPDGFHDLVFRYKLHIVTVYHIQILGVQPLQAPRDTLAHPFFRVVELIAGDATNFCEEEVLLSRNIGAHEGCVESCAEDLFGRTVVGRRVKGADAVFQGLLHEASCVKLVRVGVVLVVECGRSGRLLGFLTFTIFVVFSTTYPKIRGGRMLLSLGD